MVLIPLARLGTRWTVRDCHWWSQPALILGGGEEGAAAYRTLRDHPQFGLRPVGVVDDQYHHWSDSAYDPSWYLGPIRAASTVAEQHRAVWGVLAMANRDSAEVARSLDHFALTIPHILIPSPVSSGRRWNSSHEFGSLQAARIDEQLQLPGPRAMKRCMDVVLTVLLGIVLAPLMIAIVILIKLTSPGPALFTHQRIGQCNRRFGAWKFRTMVTNADRILRDHLAAHPALQEEWARDHKLKHDPRVTFLGRILRKTSLDELPQLWNVLVGDMSLVGPRPIVDEEILKYGDVFPLYLRVRPGITGVWQINGRNNTTYAQRVAYDQEYARNWSPWLDICILFRTILVVLRCEGAY
jgi:Undecaprenyl-phosphate galactose phosphotransferase WbaP